MKWMNYQLSAPPGDLCGNARSLIEFALLEQIRNEIHQVVNVIPVIVGH